MHRSFRTFIGVDLGGGKGKTTAVARLRLAPGLDASAAGPSVILDEGDSDRPWYDDRLVEYLLRHAGEAVVAIDAPLTLPNCVRCTLPSCPGYQRCDVDVVRWFRQRAAAAPGGERRDKPRYTPYTQRAAEVLLHEDYGILPRETLGQGMGPLTARGAYLRKALSGAYALNRDLLEVYPKATLAQLFPDRVDAQAPAAASPAPAAGRPGRDRLQVVYRDGNGQERDASGRALGARAASRVARHYKRSAHAAPVREAILQGLPGLLFGPGQWREFVLQNDHLLDAVLCAYTAFLWARDGWLLPDEQVLGEDGWIWFPGAPQGTPPPQTGIPVDRGAARSSE